MGSFHKITQEQQIVFEHQTSVRANRLVVYSDAATILLRLPWEEARKLAQWILDQE